MSNRAELATLLETLRSKYREPWHVDKEPHDYADGTKHFNHVRYISKALGGEITVEVASYVTPDLGELLCALHNNLDVIIAALHSGDPA